MIGKNCDALQRIENKVNHEMFSALYLQQSYLYYESEIGSGVYDLDMGEGLFSTMAYKNGDMVAKFHGQIITCVQYYRKRDQRGANFMIKLRDD